MKKFINYQQRDNDFFPSGKIVRVKTIPTGVYKLMQTMSGDIFASKMDILNEPLITFPNFVSTQIINEVNHFWSKEVRNKYEKRNLLYKRGILLHGKYGTGKTSVIMKIIEDQLKNGSLVFYCPSPSFLSEFSKIIREIEGDRKILVVYEDFEKMLALNEQDFLSLLDGEMQIDNVVYLASTNYINQIPNRIKDRPSRFATVIEVGLPDEDTRKVYIESKTFPEENIDIELWVKKTEGLTIDQIKDLIISVFCIDLTLDDAITRLLNNDKGTELYYYDENDPYLNM